MRHYKKGRKLGSSASHTKAIKKNLCVALFTNDRIKTTLERAKEIRGDVDRIVTWAKRGDVHSRRLAIAKLGDQNLVAEIFSKVEQGMYKDRQGGYSRILRLGTRRGDAAVIVIMELVQEPVKKKKASSEDKAARDEKSSKPAASTAASAVEDDEIIDIEAEELAEADSETPEVSEADEVVPDEAEAETDKAEADEAAPTEDEPTADEAAESAAEAENTDQVDAPSEDVVDVEPKDEGKEKPEADEGKEKPEADA